MKILLFGLLFPIFAYSYKFGYDGWNGRNAIHGRDGAPGPNIIIQANLPGQSFDLSGQDGGDAGFAQDGENARSCIQPRRVQQDLKGAKGGNAGLGGNAGDGGKGGNATIYYDSKDQLKQIHIISKGGSPGSASYAGRPGRGCKCTSRTWRIRHCRKVKDKNGRIIRRCHYTRYHCTDGRDGWRASNGISGRWGTNGRITLISNNKQPSKQNLHISGSIKKLVRSPIILTENIWQIQNGMQALLAPNSFVNDTYREYLRTKTQKINIVWLEKQNIPKDAQLWFSMKNAKVSYHTNEGYWINAKFAEDDFEIHNYVDTKDVLNISSSISGKGSQLFLDFTDISNIAHLLNNELHLKIQRKATFGYKTVYDGPVSKEFLIANARGFSLDLSALNLNPKTFKKDKTIKFFIQLNRSFKHKEVLWKYNFKYKNI